MPGAFVRATKLAFRATPLGMGFGRTRVASPSNAFEVLCVASDLSTSLAGTLHDESDADGILHRSRSTDAPCCAVYERAIYLLAAGPVVEAVASAGLVPALKGLGVDVISPR